MKLLNLGISSARRKGGIDKYTVLMLHMNGDDDGTTFPDSSTENNKGNASVTADVNTKTGIKKFGTASALFDGDSGYLSYADSVDWNFGANPFTIDFWLYPTDDGDTKRVWATDEAEKFGFMTYIHADRRFGLLIGNGINWIVNLLTTTYLTLNAWNHIAIVREGVGVNQIKIYIGGIVGATGTYATNGGSSGDIGDKFYIGYWPFTSEYYQGYIDEFRVSKGIARWTENFTPPTEEYF